MSEGMTKAVLGALVGIVITGTGAWFALAGDVVTEAKAIDLIEVHSPYSVDRKILLQGLEEVKGIREQMFLMRADMSALLLYMKAANEKHDEDH